jgi:hypothetical protein
MKARLIGACIIATLSLVVPAAVPMAAEAATIELDIDTMPRGDDMHVPWLDKTDDTIHDDSVIFDLTFDHPLVFRYANFGYVVDGEGNRLIYHQFNGETRDVGAAQLWRIRTGLKAGRQIAAITRKDGSYWLHVRSLVGDPASSLVFRKRLGSMWRLRGFHNTRVWIGEGYIDIRNGRFVKVPRLDSSRRRSADTRLNVVASSRAGQLGITVSPLLGTAFAPWSRADGAVYGWSPDGKYVVTRTAVSIGPDDDPYTLSIRLRNARTGQLVHQFNGLFEKTRIRWEDDEHFLIAMGGASDDWWDAPLAWARIGVDGSAERASEFSGDMNTGGYLQPMWNR